MAGIQAEKGIVLLLRVICKLKLSSLYCDTLIIIVHYRKNVLIFLAVAIFLL